MAKSIRTLVIVFFVCMLFFTCASNSAVSSKTTVIQNAGAQETEQGQNSQNGKPKSNADAGSKEQVVAETVPAWVLQEPKSTATAEIFVASGRDTSAAKAEELAIGNLIATINLYLGVTVQTVTEAEARASIESYEADIRTSVLQKSSGNIAGLLIKDKYQVKDKSGNITVYVLCEYKKTDLEAEKRKRAELIAEREDAVSIPENKGLAAEKAGNLFEALRYFVEAAGAASNSEIRNADVKFERNINHAQRIASQFDLEKLAAPTEILVKQAFTTDFIVKLKEAVSGNPIAGADFEVSYNEYNASGTVRIKRVQVKSNADGLVSIRLPAPQKVTNEKVTFALDLSAYTKAISNLRGNNKTIAANLLDNLNNKRTVLDFTVTSNAKNISTAVIIMDLNEAGGLSRGTSVGMDAIKQELSINGFKIPVMTIGPNFLEGKGDADILGLAKNTVGHAAKRFAYGSVQIISFEKLNGSIMARASGKITVADVASGTILFTYTKNQTAMGTSNAEAQKNAMAAVGKDMAQAMVSNLP